MTKTVGRPDAQESLMQSRPGQFRGRLLFDAIGMA
jgi:hypothetical protein